MAICALKSLSLASLFFPKPTFSIQCNVILITPLILLLSTLNEPKEKEITSVQSSIFGLLGQT